MFFHVPGRRTPCVHRLLRRHELGAIAEGGAADVASLGRHPEGRLEVRFAGLKDAIKDDKRRKEWGEPWVKHVLNNGN